MVNPKKTEFITSVFNIEDLPVRNLPEIVFAGKSNVGKSSMINSLLNNKIAKVSNTPGRTQSINYFLINDSYYFVDLPGYGFSKTSLNMKEKWALLIDQYFKQGRDIKAVIQIVDIRHKPKEKDLELLEYLKFNNFYSVIACSKSDKLSNDKIFRNMKIIKDTMSIDSEFLSYSVKTGMGYDKLWTLIEKQISKV